MGHRKLKVGPVHCLSIHLDDPGRPILLLVCTDASAGAGFVVVPMLAMVELSLVPAPLILSNMALTITMAVRGRASIDARYVPSIVFGRRTAVPFFAPMK